MMFVDQGKKSHLRHRARLARNVASASSSRPLKANAKPSPRCASVLLNGWSASSASRRMSLAAFCASPPGPVGTMPKSATAERRPPRALGFQPTLSGRGLRFAIRGLSVETVPSKSPAAYEPGRRNSGQRSSGRGHPRPVGAREPRHPARRLAGRPVAGRARDTGGPPTFGDRQAPREAFGLFEFSRLCSIPLWETASREVRTADRSRGRADPRPVAICCMPRWPAGRTSRFT